MRDLFYTTAHLAKTYMDGLAQRPVAPTPAALARLAELRTPLPDSRTHPEDVIDLLDSIGSPATVATSGGRYFGFVTGGSLPASLAANWLAAAWDQNAAISVMSPIAATLEEVTLSWLVDLFGLPRDTGGGFVTGATMANFSAIAAARHALLQRQGWDVEADGLFGAPPITVVVGEEVHVSLLKALQMLGMGRQRVVRVPVDAQGRMRPDALPPLDDHTLLCIQAGNVNTGAFDPAPPLIEAAHAANAWVHVDGAFGLWAWAAPDYQHHMAGYEQADSWATDAHKWLNVPYDCGLVLVRDAAALRGAMSATGAAYLAENEPREPYHYVPEMSRRARGIEVWAALLSLGRQGLAEMITRHCQQAQLLATGLQAKGYQVLNEVVINQVLVSFGEAAATERVIAALQRDGAAWAGGTLWQGQRAMRISVSSWATTDDDIAQTVEALHRLAQMAG